MKAPDVTVEDQISSLGRLIDSFDVNFKRVALSYSVLLEEHKQLLEAHANLSYAYEQLQAECERSAK